MKYYVQYDNHGVLVCINTDFGGVEITHEEYDRLLSEIRAKAAHVDAVYADPAKIDAVPAEWRDEILRRVEDRKAMEPKPTDEVDAEELGAMLMEVL